MENESNEKKGLPVVSIRLVDEPPLLSDEPIQSPEDAVKLMEENLSEYDREIVSVLNLTNKGQVINANLVSMGSLTSSIVHPREIFKSAILSNAGDMILLHNHPSGDPTPSAEDYGVTQRISECGELLGIRLLDHIIVGTGGRYYSFNANKELTWQKDARNYKQSQAAECPSSDDPKGNTFEEEVEHTR